MTIDRDIFLAMVDHTVLSATATASDIDAVVDQAADLGPAAVCVNGFWVHRVADRLGARSIGRCAVVGFPLGAGSSAAKAAEAASAVSDGATEVDMVVNLGLLLAGTLDGVESDIGAVRGAVAPDTIVKVILETATLTDDQIVDGCQAARRAGADFVKTSTGFHAAGGASVDAVALMAATVGDDLGVKASGGIRTLADVESMVQAGATRLGMSATLAVLAEIEARSEAG